MFRWGKSAGRLLFLLASALLLGGCQGVGALAGGDRPASSRQLIVKFRPDTVPCTPAGISGLSRASRVPLEFVRPMSGGACVVRQFADGEGGFLEGEKALKGNPAVEYLEPDTVMKPL